MVCGPGWEFGVRLRDNGKLLVTLGKRWIGSGRKGGKLGTGKPGVGCEAIRMSVERVQCWLEGGISGPEPLSVGSNCIPFSLGQHWKIPSLGLNISDRPRN